MCNVVDVVDFGFWRKDVTESFFCNQNVFINITLCLPGMTLSLDSDVSV